MGLFNCTIARTMLIEPFKVISSVKKSSLHFRVAWLSLYFDRSEFERSPGIFILGLNLSFKALKDPDCDRL